MAKKVGIVGAGISGLLACKYALSKGYHPTVFEAQPHLGGVWAATVETTRLQTPRPLYEFSDHPWPASVEHVFPTGEQVLDYVRSYAEKFGLLEHVRFNTKVVGMDFDGVATEEEMEGWRLWGGAGEAFGKGKWTLKIQDVQTQSQQEVQFDFVILCIGRFTDLPNIPEFPAGQGPEVFHGKVMHSKDYAAMSNDEARNLVKGKRVAVVGLQKSALDIALESSIANGSELPCHLIFRRPGWNVLDYSVWGYPLPVFYLSRFAELLIHKPGEGVLQSLFATTLSPLRWAINKFVESDIKHRQPLKKFGIVPDFPFSESLFSCTFAIVPEGFYDNVEKGSIILKKAQKFSFCKSGIVMEGEEEKPLDVDVVIFATGFKGDQKLGNVFSSPKYQSCIMGSPDSAIPLYRQCIHPRIPQVAILGYSESVSNLYTSEIRCRWLMELLDGSFKLPGIKKMNKDILEWDKFMKRYLGRHYRRSCIGAIHIWYNDQLCKDLGINPKRKKGLISEYFDLYLPSDYATPS